MHVEYKTLKTTGMYELVLDTGVTVKISVRLDVYSKRFYVVIVCNDEATVSYVLPARDPDWASIGVVSVVHHEHKRMLFQCVEALAPDNEEDICRVT